MYLVLTECMKCVFLPENAVVIVFSFDCLELNAISSPQSAMDKVWF